MNNVGRVNEIHRAEQIVENQFQMFLPEVLVFLVSKEVVKTHLFLLQHKEYIVEIRGVLIFWSYDVDQFCKKATLFTLWNIL